MKHVPRIISDETATANIRLQSLVATYDGRGLTPYFRNCAWLWEKYECQIIFTRDVGHHSSGWWKNPDYERCFHLSISFFGERSKKYLKRMLEALFGENKRLLWIEPPYSAEGKQREVWHYRLFCDENWQPIKPRGEVYSTEFTELGWKSYSEVQANG